LTRRARGRTLVRVERRLARETALLAACLVAAMPLLVLASLDRSLPALAVVVAVPAGDDAEAVAAALASDGLAQRVATADADRTADLWRTLAAEATPPTVIEAELWPAAAVDVAALRRRVDGIAPAAVTAVERRARAEPRAAVALAGGVAGLALTAAWRVRCGVRRALDRERTKIELVRRFGATRAWVDVQFARPLVRRARWGALAGGGAGALLGTAAAVMAEPALFRPWTGAATAVVAATALTFALAVALLARLAEAAARRRLARATGATS
jgi:hypothetical protein